MKIYRSFPRAIVIAAGVAVSVTAHAGQPVYLSVVGDGRIQMRVAEAVGARVAAPCDSSQNRMLLNGWISGGQSITLTASGRCICVQHTYGAFRQTNWTQARIICDGPINPSTSLPEPYIRLVIPTDRPMGP